MGVEQVRLHKYLAMCGACSRRKAESLISLGLVTVNGKQVLELGTKITPGVDKICLRNSPVKLEIKKYYAFNKPRSVVSTLYDPQKRKCIADYTSELPNRVYPVGRLDYDVTGLILLTNDGEFAEQMMHPRFEVKRKYLAVIKGELSEETKHKLIKGVKLKDGFAKAVSVKKISATEKNASYFKKINLGESLIQLEVAEGRNHFVKRLLSYVGHPVLQLCRVGFGSYLLGDLKPGEIREVKLKAREA